MELGNALFGNSRGPFHIENRRSWTEVLYQLFTAMGCDGYGEEFENEMFEMHRYWWGDCTCGQEELDPEEDCLSTCCLVRPNFRFKPTGYEISWYKYALRDSYQNQNLKLSQFAHIVEQCVESLKKPDGRPPENT